MQVRVTMYSLSPIGRVRCIAIHAKYFAFYTVCAGCLAFTHPLHAEPVKIFDGYDAYGNDYRSLENIQLADCKTICEATDDCTAFTFNLKSNVCFLKNAASNLYLTSDAISGVKETSAPSVSFKDNIEVLPGVSSVGVNYNVVSRLDFEGCYLLCERDELCKGFTLRSGRCELKLRLGRFSKSSKSVSGVKGQ